MNELLEQNKTLVADFIESVWNDERHEGFERFWVDDCVNHTAPAASEGLESLRRTHQPFFDAFSHLRVEMLDQVAEGDRVVSRIAMTGTHVGDFMGVSATTRRVRMEGIRIDRVRDNRIVEHWAQFDQVGLLAQLRSSED
ncbi:MAG: ester cyclase [Myxococcota bacterium]